MLNARKRVCGTCRYFANPHRGFMGMLYGDCTLKSQPNVAGNAAFKAGVRGSVLRNYHSDMSTWEDAVPCQDYQPKEAAS